MFRARADESAKPYRYAIIGLLSLSFLALVVTIWVMNDFLREQQIVKELIQQLPVEATASAEELAGELRWQFRLTALVVLNLIVTFFAMILLWRAYRSSQRTLRDITALAGDILGSVEQTVITTDLSGVITSINDRGIELLGLEDDFVGRPLDQLSDALPLEKFRLLSQQHASRRKVQDYPLATKGNTRTLRVRCQPLRDHANAIIGNVLQLLDVTERKLVDERVLRMERYMGLGSVAAGLHHEIKNPLAALSLHVQLLEEQLEEQGMSRELQESVDVIKTELSRVGQVLESFRDFTALGRLNVSNVDVAALIQHQVKLLSPQAQQTGVDITLETPEELPRVSADRARLEQVVHNLLMNAIEAMPLGGALFVSAKRCDAPLGDAIGICIADNGPGIPKDLQENVFDPYFTTKNEGTGMGLAICDKIVRQHNGNLEFRCTPNGTFFEVTLPLDSERATP